MPASDLELAKSAIAEAGELAIRFFHSCARAWDKQDGTIVTEADLAVDELLKKRLQAHRPQYGWLSEETSQDQSWVKARRAWVVDPIDGTRSFADGGDEWTIVISLLEDDVPLYGLVFHPLKEMLYTAKRGGGAQVNDEKLVSSPRARLCGSKLMIKPGVMKAQRWQSPLPPIEQQSVSSLALRLCSVARGSVDATVAAGDLHHWDVAAGSLIAREAGAKVSTCLGEPLDFSGPRSFQRGGLVAAGANIHDELVSHTQTLDRHGK